MYRDWLDIPGWIMNGCKTQKKYILAAAGFDPLKKEVSFKQKQKIKSSSYI